MKPLILAIAAGGLLISGNLAMAQAPQGSSPRATNAPAPPAPPPAPTGKSAPSDEAAASGDNNQAVTTTTANAMAPAKGANSFTMGEAKSRIESSGFSNIGDLTKDDNGVWHGPAQKAGNSTTVWLDYKGNVGESK